MSIIKRKVIRRLTLRIFFNILTHRRLLNLYFNLHTVPHIFRDVLSKKLGKNSSIRFIDIRYPNEFSNYQQKQLITLRKMEI